MYYEATIVQKIFRIQCFKFIDIDTIPTISQWYFCQLTAQIQTKQKVSKLSSLNVAQTWPLPGRSAREVREEVHPMHAATNGSLSFNLTLWNKNILFKRLLKVQDTCVFSCWSSTVNWTPLNTSGEQYKTWSTIVTSVITCLMAWGWRKISWRHWVQFPYKPGKISCFGWKHVGRDWDHSRLNSRSRKIQLKAVQITQTYTREHSYTCWLMYVWCGVLVQRLANLAHINKKTPSILHQILIPLRDFFIM